MIFADQEILSGPKQKRKSGKQRLERGKSAERYYSENPAKRPAGPVNPWDIGKYSKPLNQKQIDDVRRTQELINEEIKEKKKLAIEESLRQKGYYDEYDKGTKTLKYKTRPGQYSDPPLNPIEDFKRFDQGITNKIKTSVSEYVTDNITGPTKEFIEEKVTEPVTKFFEGWQWYHWALLAAGALLIFFLLFKGKQVVTQFIPWK